MFLKLLDKHFSKNNKLDKTFNRNSFKVSYSCKENISQITSSHSKNILQPNKNEEPLCNCRQKKFSMLRRYRTKNGLYKSIVSTPTKSQRVYVSISEDEWKKRYYNHIKSF